MGFLGSLLGFEDNKLAIVEAIYKAIESEKKVLEVFRKEIIRQVERGEKVMTPLAHTIYFNLKRESEIVNDASSRDMYQGLKSVAINCDYDGAKDQCGGTIGDFTLSLSREKDSQGAYVMISAMPSIPTIVHVANQVVSNYTKD